MEPNFVCSVRTEHSFRLWQQKDLRPTLKNLRCCSSTVASVNLKNTYCSSVTVAGILCGQGVICSTHHKKVALMVRHQMLRCQQPVSHEKPGHVSGPGKPGLVLTSSVWLEPESGAASLQSSCEQTQDPMLHWANTYPWQGCLSLW